MAAEHPVSPRRAAPSVPVVIGRRGFLGGLLAAPAIIRTPGLLMAVKPPRMSDVIYRNTVIRSMLDTEAMVKRNVLLDDLPFDLRPGAVNYVRFAGASVPRLYSGFVPRYVK